MARKKVGVHETGDSVTIVFPSRETRDGYRSITLPMEAWTVVREHLVPQQVVTLPPRRAAAMKALEKQDGLSIGLLATSTLDILGEDTEDHLLRTRMCGMINEMGQAGLIQRCVENGKEVFRLPPDYKKK